MADADRMDTPEQAEFREYCRSWLADNHPGRPPVRLPQGALELSDPEALAWLKKWQKSAYDAGLIGCDYPVECGGGGKENFQNIANPKLLLSSFFAFSLKAYCLPYSSFLLPRFGHVSSPFCDACAFVCALLRSNWAGTSSISSGLGADQCKNFLRVVSVETRAHTVDIFVSFDTLTGYQP